LLWAGASLGQERPADRHVDFSIATQPMAKALNEFATQADLRIVFYPQAVQGLVAPQVIGSYSPTEALRILLANSSLQYRFTDERTVAVKVASPAGGQTSTSNSASQETESPLGVARAQNESPPMQESTASQMRGSASVGIESPKLEQIIVTAQKREERQSDVPVAMTVIDPRVLAESGQNRLVDYFASVPGLNVTGNAYFGGTNYMTIRGLSSGVNHNPAVATVIDDVPTTSSLFRGQGMLTSPDLDPSDLARIEVLKGPQGTLYGADSLSGLIKYVTVDPSTTALSARAEVFGIDIPDGGVGYVVRGAVNIPISDTFALRASAFSRRDPGYIDDITTGEKNFNSADVHGGRAGVLWRPSENLSVKLSGLIQQARGDVSLVDSNSLGQPTLGDLKYTSLPGTTQYRTQDQLYSATINDKIGGLEIVSVTGYVVNELSNWSDDTVFDFAGAYFPGYMGDPVVFARTTHKVSEELRVGSSIGHWFDWRLGGFYTYENTPFSYGAFYAADPTTGAVVGDVYDSRDTTLTFTEYAAFADLDAHFTDRFDVQIGGRESWNKQAQQTVFSGKATLDFTGFPPPYVQPLLRTDANAFTYLVTPRFTISRDLMVYARIASGYRIGGSNVNGYLPANKALGIPGSYAPDRTTNYELGVKGDVLEHRFSFDAAAYYIAWKNFQMDLTEPGFINFTANAGRAKSEGVELSIEARPLKGLTIAAEGSYDNAVLTQNLPSTSTAYGQKGERLPYSMRLSGGVSINQDMALSDDWVGFLGAAFNYIGSRPYEFTTGATQPRIEFPSYTQLNLHTGARHASWVINLYVNNVTNKRGIIGILPSYAIVAPGGYYTTVIQPRTLGLGINTTF